MTSTYNYNPDIIPIYRILIDSTVESFINARGKELGMSFRFVSEDNITSFIMVDLARLIEFSANIISVYRVGRAPATIEHHDIDFRGLIQPS
jgi:hypothetical protein